MPNDTTAKQAKVVVLFPTYENLPDEKKSFVNFFMENSTLVFAGNEDENENFYMSGCIKLQLTNNLFAMVVYEQEDDSSSEPSTLNILPNGTVDCRSTLLATDTSLKIYKRIVQSQGGNGSYDNIGGNGSYDNIGGNGSYDNIGGNGSYDNIGGNGSYDNIIGSTNSGNTDSGDQSSGAQLQEITSFGSIPVRLSVRFEDSKNINENENTKIEFVQANGDVLQIAMLPNSAANYNYQLRTSNFTIENADNGDRHDVFYKIIILTSSNVSVNDIKNEMTTDEDSYIYLSPNSSYQADYSSDNYTQYTRAGSSELNLINSVGYVSISKDDCELPVVTQLVHTDSNDEVDAIICYKLFENTEEGAVAVTDTDDVLPNHFYVHILANNEDITLNDGTAYAGSTVKLKYTDENLNGGNVQIKSGNVIVSHRFYFTADGYNDPSSTFNVTSGLNYSLYDDDGELAEASNYTFDTNNDGYIFCTPLIKSENEDNVYMNVFNSSLKCGILSNLSYCNISPMTYQIGNAEHQTWAVDCKIIKTVE